VSAEPAGDADDLPEFLQRLLTASADLPLRHRMPRGNVTATARRSAVLILFGDYPVGTALREAEEEAGVDPAGVRVLATLPELFLGPSDNLVVPVVGWWEDPGEVTIGDPREVARVARVPLAELADPANRFRVGHPSGYVGPAFGVADMVVWGFTAALLDAILEAAGLARPWHHDDVRPLPAPGARAASLPGTVGEDDEEDAAAPTVADPPPDGPPTRTVGPR
jgi:ADP-ribose pyrophosphatase YjhB (NUDIX family)